MEKDRKLTLKGLPVNGSDFGHDFTPNVQIFGKFLDFGNVDELEVVVKFLDESLIFLDGVAFFHDIWGS